MAVLKLTLFHTKTVANMAEVVFNKQIQRGNAFLKPHGISFQRYPERGSIELDWTAPIAESGRENPGRHQRLELRRKANDTYYSEDNRLPVILCQIGGKTGGEAPGSIDQKFDWLPWVIMDAFTLNDDGLTLTHEAGHCAGLKHPGYGSNAEPRLMMGDDAVTDNIMAYGTFDIATQSYMPRSLVETWQVNAYRTAYFYSA
ncbi:hypothetical protein ACE7GA_00995 [Roseomonas sp. CCTCC AB2023176]|uniref:hypothetical protein n=1 Tax=Roseomonas sp. CCTCC AB2023176 TaxID=3342640 RepID=UPI0035DFABC0